MPTPSDADLLAAAKEALEAILARRVSSYRVGITDYSMLNIDDLRELINELEAKVNAASGAGFSVARFVNPGS